MSKINHLKLPLSLLALGLLNYFFLMLFNIIVAKHTSNGVYGDFTIATKTLGIAVGLLLLGTNIGSKRFLAYYLKINDTKNVNNYYKWNLHLLLISSIVLLMVVAIFCLAFYCLQHLNIMNLDKYHLAIDFLWLAPIGAIINLFSSYFLCKQHYYLQLIFGFVGQSLVLLLFAAAALLFFENYLSQTHLLFIQTGMFVIILIIEIYFLNKKMPFNLFDKLPSIFSYQKQNYNPEWIKTNLTLVSNEVIYLIVVTVDLLIVEIISPHEQMVDWYSAMIAISSVLITIASSINNINKPYITSKLKTNEQSSLQRIMNKNNSLLFCLLFLVSFIIILFRERILLTFGAGYTGASNALIIMVLSNLFATVVRPAVSLLAFSDNQKIILQTTSTELVLVAILCTIGTLLWGIVGTASAVALIQFVKLVYLTYQAKSKTGIKPLVWF